MPTTRTEIVNTLNGDILASRTEAPFTQLSWDSTGYTGDVEAVRRWYVDDVLVDESPIISGTQTASEPTSYDAATTEYFTAMGVPDDTNASPYTGLTNRQCWELFNSVVTYYKAQGAWTGIKLWLPEFRTKRGFNGKAPALYKHTFVGGWVESALGNKGNGSNAYAYSGDAADLPVGQYFANKFNPSEHFDLTDVALTNVITAARTGSTTDVISGVNDTTNRVYTNINLKASTIGNSASTVTYSGGDTGVITVSRAGTSVKAFVNGVQSGTPVTGAGTGLPMLPSIYGARNNNSVIENFTTATLADKMYHLASIDPAVIYEGLRMWNEGLGRKTW